MQVYICPMHPEIRRDKSGICPECGMNLIPEKIESRKKKIESKNHKEHDKYAGHSTQMFLQKFWVSLILTIPVVIYSDLPQVFFNWTAPSLEIRIFKLEIVLPLILGSVVFFYGGWVFLIGAWREIKAALPGMMTLIAVAISAAYLYSVWASFADENTLFWELTTLINIMLLGHYLEMRAVSGAQSALKELSKLLPDTAERIRSDGSLEEVRLQELKDGDLIFVRPGSRVAADGVVVEGRSEIDESMVTGESRPAAKNEDSEVIAGTINGDGSLKIKITKIGENTFLAGVMRLVAEAQASKSRLQILADRAAFYLTLIAISGSLLTFFLWLSSGNGFAFAVSRLVAVLVIACPHALGLAIPLVSSISTTLAAKAGFLIKQRLAFESAGKIDIVLFDKTGTLTKGEFGVTEVIGGDEVLYLAASVDSHSEHFVSKAIVAEAGKKNLKIGAVKNFQRLPGRGASGEVDDRKIFVGGEAIFDQIPDIGSQVSDQVKNLTAEGKTIIYVIADGKVLGAIVLADVIREESKEAIRALRSLGIKTAMITGDSEEVAKAVAAALEIDDYFAGVLPDEKSAKVKILQQKGLKVAMVGDGVNDAPALAQADLGVAIGAGTNVALESAGIILVRNDPRDIVRIIKLSRLTYAKMVQNIFWATGYNVAALPLAAGILASRGIILEPALAAVLMSLSTIIVAINAVLLKRKKIL